MSVLALRPAPRGGCEPGSAPGWQSLTTLPRPWVAAAFAGCAVFAGAVAEFSTTPLHRRWGTMAVGAYALAAIAVLAWKSHGVHVALLVSLGGALIAPLSWMAAVERWQPEVSVMARSAQLLIQHGTPYQSAAVIAAAHDPNAYNPYLPALIVFGIPRALWGDNPLTDPRIWIGVVSLGLLILAFVVARAPDVIRWMGFVAASPVIAFALSVSGIDLPELALICLGLALLWERPGKPSRPVLAGLVLGVAVAMKATTWPALIVVIAMLARRDGRRATVSFSTAALGVFAAIVVPVLVVEPASLMRNTVVFPLGLTRVKTQAASPLPGHLIASTGIVGHWIAIALLLLGGLAIAASLVIRPPRDVPSATWRLIIGLTLMFSFAPATRFGYFMYPLGIWAWLQVSSLARRSATVSEPAHADAPLAT